MRLYADVVHAYSRGVLRGIADFAKVHGGWDFDFDPRPEANIARPLSRDQIHGILIHLHSTRTASALIRSGIPAVNVANQLCPPALMPSVIPDDRAVGAMAAAYFQEIGFRNFAYCGAENLQYSRNRARGLRQRPQAIPVRLRESGWR